MNDQDLVYIDEYGLLGTNYYWRKSNDYKIFKYELMAANLASERIKVHPDIIKSLKQVDDYLKTKGYRLYISEGYRPKELYKLIYEKRIKQFGKEMTDRLINMDKMPHATGRTVDVILWSVKENKEVPMRDKNDGAEALFIDFYKNKTDSQSIHFQQLQQFLIETMQRFGFSTGPKREYFHFNYKG